MTDARLFDDLAETLGRLLPPGVKEVKDDFEKNARAAMQGAFSNLDLVTREEFSVQQKVLERTRAQVDELTERVTELEALLSDKPPPSAN